MPAGISYAGRRISCAIAHFTNPQGFISLKKAPFGAFFWWAFRDSNPGPTGYEPVALTN